MGLSFAWTDPGWLGRAEAWIDRELEPLGRPRTGPVDQSHVRSWATAIRVPTGRGDVWFKAMLPVLAYEAGVVRVLARARPEVAPELLAADLDSGWMLLEDAGERLRELTAGDPDEAVRRWTEVLPLYAELQRAAAPDVDALLAAGIPDFRLAAIPGIYEGLLADEAPLRVTEEALRDDEIRELHALAPEVAAICGELAALGYPETVQHDDLHDGQVFVRDGRYRVLDWGDACVSHPFSTLTVTLNSIAHGLGLDRTGPELVRTRDAYLDAWPGPRAERLRAFELADRLGCLSRAWNYQRLAAALAPEHAEEVADGHPGWLKGFLETRSGP